MKGTRFSIEELDGIAFDLDGVILESAQIKTDAFEKLFEHLPEHSKAIRSHHLENQGISRYEKFDWIYRELLRQPLSEAASRRLGEQFGELVVNQTLSCPFVPGARALLGRLKRMQVPVFVASGTPHAELEHILRSRNLLEMLDDFWGSPTPKDDILRGILKRLATDPHRLLMVGDALSDLRAARKTETLFVARAAGEDRGVWHKMGIPSIEDLDELANELQIR